jgi:uncharacterized protein with HEPN domain
MTKVYTPYFALIRESIAAIESYQPAEKDIFLASPVLQDAVLMRLQVIGESLMQMRALDDDAFEQRAAESWNQVIGLRNIISHGYRTIDFERTWQIITDELPPFASDDRRCRKPDQLNASGPGGALTTFL